MVTTGLIVRLDAKPEKEEDLAAFLRDALPLAENEPQTVAWFAVRTSASSFAIVDVFPDESGRQASELLAQSLEIERVDVLAAKLNPTKAER